MDKSKITEKIKEHLTPEDLAIFESAIDKLVKDALTLREEELKKEYDSLSEKYCQKRINEELEKRQASLIEEYDAKLSNLEQKVVTRLDAFLDHVVMEKVSDEKIEKIALNEIAVPLVEKIKQLFGETFITIDSDGSAQMKESEKKVRDLEKQLSEAISDKMDSEEKLDKTAAYLMISEKTQGLKESAKARVVNMFKDKKFVEVQNQIDNFIGLVKESKELPKSDEKPTIDDKVSEDDGIKEDKKVISESSDLVKIATKFMDE